MGDDFWDSRFEPVTHRALFVMFVAKKGDYRYVRLLDVDSEDLYRSVLESCERVGSFRVVGWCRRRWLMDLLFECRR